MTMIVDCARFAAAAHKNQFRKYNGKPYIVHPMRVAGAVTLLPDSSDEQIAAAWLHDVLEDTKVTEEELLAVANPETVRLVVELTNRNDYPPDMNRAARKAADRERLAKVSWEARIVKLCDRADNLLDLPDGDFLEFYLQESLELYGALTLNNPGLHAHPAAIEFIRVAQSLPGRTA